MFISWQIATFDLLMLYDSYSSNTLNLILKTEG